MDPSYLFYVFAGRLPLLLLLLGGIVFATIRWNRHPKVSLLVILGLVFYLLESTFFTLLIFLMPTILPTGAALVASGPLYTILFVIDDLAYVAVIIVLVSAVFAQRKLEQAPAL